MRGTAVGLCTAALLVLTGCSGGGGDEVVVTTTAGPTSADSPTAADLAELDEPLRGQAQWVLGLLAPDAQGPTPQEATERFTSEFLDQVPAEELEPVLASLREGPSLTLTQVAPAQDGPEGGQSTQLTLAGEQPLQLSISVDEAGRIAGLLLQPGIPGDLPEIGSWDELEDELTTLGAEVSLYAGRVTDGACTPVHAGVSASQPAPSGSVFKLIVLAAVVDAVSQGELAWEEELSLTAQIKSLPSGELQDRADGSTVTVREAAELMISISDNTATDLLMAAVGPDLLRGAVERVSDDPDRLTPLPSTAEFFELGWDAPELRERWVDADLEQRRSILGELTGDLSGLRANPFAASTPAWPDGVDWFLTGEEICTAHAVLQAKARTEDGAPVREILSANPGLVVPEGITYQGFKGGSAPGVLAYTFYVETGPAGDAAATSGRHSEGLVLSVQVSHERAIMATRFTELTQAGLVLLAGD